MADDITLNAGTGGDTLGADDIAGVKYQIVKMGLGALDSLTLLDGNSGNKSAGTQRVVLATDQPALTNALKVDGSAVTQPVSDGGGNISIDDGGNVISVDWNGTAPPIGAGTEAAALRVTVATDSTGVLSVDDNGGALTVDNGGTFAVQVDGNALTSLQLIDDIVYTDDTSTHATGTSKGALFMAAATPTDAAVNANDIGAVAMTTDRKLHVSVQDALPAGTNAIGKLAANSGVDIGDVDVTSIAAGTNLIGDVGIQPRTTNGLDTFMASGSDGSSILVATKQTIKASAGKLYGWYLYNPEAAVSFVHIYNTDTVTVGTTNPQMTLAIPAGSAANVMSDIGITFSTAMSCSATTTAGGNTAPSTGVSAVFFYK